MYVFTSMVWCTATGMPEVPKMRVEFIDKTAERSRVWFMAMLAES